MSGTRRSQQDKGARAITPDVDGEVSCTPPAAVRVKPSVVIDLTDDKEVDKTGDVGGEVSCTPPSPSQIPTGAANRPATDGQRHHFPSGEVSSTPVGMILPLGSLMTTTAEDRSPGEVSSTPVEVISPIDRWTVTEMDRDQGEVFRTPSDRSGPLYDTPSQVKIPKPVAIVRSKYPVQVQTDIMLNGKPIGMSSH